MSRCAASFVFLSLVSDASLNMYHSYRAKARTNDALIDQLKCTQLFIFCWIRSLPLTTAFGIVKSERVEAAMRAIDRGKYAADPKMAYEDTPHGIGYCSYPVLPFLTLRNRFKYSAQTISAPHMHAMCLEVLKDHAVEG